MTFMEAHQKYLAARDAFNADPDEDGPVHKAWARSLDRLLDRPPALQDKADALAALDFVEHELCEVMRSDNLLPIIKRLRAYIKGGQS